LAIAIGKKIAFGNFRVLFTLEVKRFAFNKELAILFT
jgi:hypothetical protein